MGPAYVRPVLPHPHLLDYTCIDGFLRTTMGLLRMLRLDMFAIGVVIMSFVTWAVIRNVQGPSMPWLVAVLTTGHLMLISCSRDHGFLIDGKGPIESYSSSSESWMMSALKVSKLSYLAFMLHITDLKFAALSKWLSIHTNV